ncbi:MAG: hypothetical protein PHX74_04660 [Candidatus Sumerlaeales bacterium]|nr:hypothetical protein [Candidatus Sumerlaeales bacterium]
MNRSKMAFSPKDVRQRVITIRFARLEKAMFERVAHLEELRKCTIWAQKDKPMAQMLDDYLELKEIAKRWHIIL